MLGLTYHWSRKLSPVTFIVLLWNQKTKIQPKNDLLMQTMIRPWTTRTGWYWSSLVAAQPDTGTNWVGEIFYVWLGFGRNSLRTL